MPRDNGIIRGDSISPQRLADTAVKNNCRTIAYTYTEPTIYYELAKETMIEAKGLGLLNVFVTNGYMSRDMLEDCKGLLDAANVDLKAFNDRFYTRHCKARLDGVLDTLKYMKQLGIWVEVTTLLIPTLNDDPDELQELAGFIHSELGPETPWHVSRFHPDYKDTNLPPTEVEFVRKARQIGIDAGLHYVYTGNVPWDPGEKTFCPGCSHLLVDRQGYMIGTNHIKDGLCPKCGYKVEGLDL
jgi:pyruvate formate lyase activating enzyme